MHTSDVMSGGTYVDEMLNLAGEGTWHLMNAIRPVARLLDHLFERLFD